MKKWFQMFSKESLFTQTSVIRPIGDRYVRVQMPTIYTKALYEQNPEYINKVILISANKFIDLTDEEEFLSSARYPASWNLEGVNQLVLARSFSLFRF